MLLVKLGKWNMYEVKRMSGLSCWVFRKSEGNFGTFSWKILSQETDYMYRWLVSEGEYGIKEIQEET